MELKWEEVLDSKQIMIKLQAYLQNKQMERHNGDSDTSILEIIE